MGSEELKERILELVKKMAAESRGVAYSEAREVFDLLPRIKQLKPFFRATAKDMWEHAGLCRDDLVKTYNDERKRLGHLR